MQRDNDHDLPVPDPDGSPIHPRELDEAERRMLAEVQREEPPALQEPDGDLEAARQAVERENSREVGEDEAAAYRLSPENALDWLDDPVTRQDEEILGRWENHLDWLDSGERQPAAPAEDGEWQEPDRDRR